MSKRRGLLVPKRNTMTSSSPEPKSASQGVSPQPLAEETFVKWQSFIEAQVGFVLPKNQTHWLWHAVNRIAKEEKTTQIDLLDRVVEDETLKQKIIDAVLIPQSRFFRHQPSLEYIGEYAKKLSIIGDLQALTSASSSQSLSPSNTGNATDTIAAATDKQTDIEVEDKEPQLDMTFDGEVKVWSVGCSHGQEAWSVAMVLAKLNIPFKVWGADVNESALRQAKEGRYELKLLEELPIEYRKYALPDDKYWSVAPELKAHTEFMKYNLFESVLPELPLVDVIICQNVLIYFRQFDQRDILGRLITKLKVGGQLILSPGEASQWRHPAMQKLPNLTVNVWQKMK